jgi:hypothetical protein
LPQITFIWPTLVQARHSGRGASSALVHSNGGRHYHTALCRNLPLSHHCVRERRLRAAAPDWSKALRPEFMQRAKAGA